MNKVSNVKVAGVYALMLTGFTIWAFMNPPVARWVLLVDALLTFIAFLATKEVR